LARVFTMLSLFSFFRPIWRSTVSWRDKICTNNSPRPAPAQHGVRQAAGQAGQAAGPRGGQAPLHQGTHHVASRRV
jgi:hypothetical protein